MPDQPIHRAGDPEGTYTLAPPAPFSNTTINPAQEEAERQARQAHIAQAVAERQRDEAEARARRAVVAEEHAEAQLVEEKAAARREYFLRHPDGSDYGFEAVWKRIRPSVAEVEARQLAADTARLREQHGRIL